MREECREFLEDKLKLTLEYGQDSITHVNDGFVFLGSSFCSQAWPSWQHACGDNDTERKIQKLYSLSYQATVG